MIAQKFADFWDRLCSVMTTSLMSSSEMFSFIYSMALSFPNSRMLEIVYLGYLSGSKVSSFTSQKKLFRYEGICLFMLRINGIINQWLTGGKLRS